MVFYYVYVLLLNNGQLYIGLTNDLERRVGEHKRGKVLSTRDRRPLELVYYEAYPCKKDAEKRERYLKTSKGKRTLKLQLKNFLKDKKA